ncbi:MAG: hypothetical protein GX998_00265 [Firmicutes bacterium]|nr:hypothetical protein [Bacillota bacterium]
MEFTVNVNIKASSELLAILKTLTGIKNTQVTTPTSTPTSTPAQISQPPTQQAPTQVSVPLIPIAPPVPPAQPPQTSAAEVPVAPAQTYTMDQLAVAATQLVDAGRREELISLLTQFGVQALTALPKEQYGAFATTLRQMGAKI